MKARFIWTVLGLSGVFTASALTYIFSSAKAERPNDLLPRDACPSNALFLTGLLRDFAIKHSDRLPEREQGDYTGQISWITAIKKSTSLTHDRVDRLLHSRHYGERLDVVSYRFNPTFYGKSVTYLRKHPEKALLMETGMRHVTSPIRVSVEEFLILYDEKKSALMDK